MASHPRLLYMMVMVMLVMVKCDEEQTSGLAAMNEAPTPSPSLPKPTPLDVASPPQLPLLQPTPQPQSQQQPGPSDPLPGLFVRQETAIRKVDGLIAKIGKLDDLDAKIDRLTSILEARGEELEALVEAVEEKLSAVAGKVEEVNDKVDGVVDVVTVMDGKVEDLSGKVEDMDGRLLEMREAVEEVKMGVNGTMEDTGRETEAGEASESITSTSTSKTIRSPPPENLNVILANWTRRMEEGLEENSARTIECQEAVIQLGEVLQPFINTSNHLAASVINRIRVSNLAMDKRLGAVLHALSHRHHVLGDGLHKAISSVHSRLALLLQQGFKNVEDKVGEVAEEVRSSTEDFIAAFNSTSSTSSSASTSTSSFMSPLLLDTLDSILHLSNLTLHHLLQEEEEDVEEQEEDEGKVEGQETAEGEKEAAMCNSRDEGGNATTPTTNTTSNTITSTTTTTTTTATPPFTITTADLKETVREALRERLTHLEEQVSGLRIYLSTSLHVHGAQVEERVALVEAGLLRVVRETLSKSNRGLEKLRRASLGYLDSAVTSVSSAAVASAQATADHLSRTLTEVALMMARRMYQVEVAVRAAVGGGDGGDDSGGGERVGWQRWWWWWWCPAMVVTEGGEGSTGGGGGGGGACISALPGNASGWGAARERCRGVGGDLLTFPPTHTPLHPFLHPAKATPHSHLSSTPPPIPSFWVGGRKLLGEWRWVTGELVEGEVEEEGDVGGGDCLVVAVGEGGGVTMAASPCNTPRPALCQLSGPLGNDPGPPLAPHNNEVTPIASYHFLTPDDLLLA